jgi:hypothetical protein
MARYYGEVGYGTSVEDPAGSGIWVDVITEFTYQGDVIRNARQVESNVDVIADVTVANSISIVADDYAIDNFMNIKYARWEGALWTVTTVEVRRPRLILTLGKIYNGPTVTSTG